MSWMPTNDPVLGDPKSCDALELVIVPRTRDLGDGFEVRRALPHGKRQMVGPFIFFDHFGPVQFVSGKGMDVRPHPHIGLATVTYLFDGSVMHRDSEGNIQEIQPGAMNLMTAGRGIAHSERTPDVQRKSGQKMLGLRLADGFVGVSSSSSSSVVTRSCGPRRNSASDAASPNCGSRRPPLFFRPHAIPKRPRLQTRQTSEWGLRLR